MSRTRLRSTVAAGAGLALTAGVLAVAMPQAHATDIPVVTNLRVGQHATFDRAVVDLTGYAPAVRTRWVTKAQNCATGDTLYVPGKKFLEVVVEPSQAHTNSGKNAYVGPGRTKSAFFGLKNLKGVRMTCDFEGQVSWVLGFDHKATVTTGKLSNPRRLYVDVKH
ncbi:MAG: AMIN-like domain-containing (lipo)protein [Sporichthyaceae bacterium]